MQQFLLLYLLEKKKVVLWIKKKSDRGKKYKID